MAEPTIPILLEFDPILSSEVAELLTTLQIESEETARPKQFGGDTQLYGLIIEVVQHSASVVAGAIAALALMRRGKTVKMNGFEVKGMSVSEITALLDAVSDRLPGGGSGT